MDYWKIFKMWFGGKLPFFFDSILKLIMKLIILILIYLRFNLNHINDLIGKFVPKQKLRQIKKM